MSSKASCSRRSLARVTLPPLPQPSSRVRVFSLPTGATALPAGGSQQARQPPDSRSVSVSLVARRARRRTVHHKDSALLSLFDCFARDCRSATASQPGPQQATQQAQRRCRRARRRTVYRAGDGSAVFQLGESLLLLSLPSLSLPSPSLASAHRVPEGQLERHDPRRVDEQHGVQHDLACAGRDGERDRGRDTHGTGTTPVTVTGVQQDHAWEGCDGGTCERGCGRGRDGYDPAEKAGRAACRRTLPGRAVTGGVQGGHVPRDVTGT